MTFKLVCPKCEAQNSFEIDPPNLFSASLTCPACSTAFRTSIVTIRAKRGRNLDTRSGRHFSIRVTDDAGSEHLIEFDNASTAEFELRSKDIAAFSYLVNELRVVQNFTINQYYIVSKPQCYLATHVYGPTSREVVLLRRFRDCQLLGSALGARFVCLYYRSSPWLIGGKVGSNKLVVHFIRFVLECVLLVLPSFYSRGREGSFTERQ